MDVGLSRVPEWATWAGAAILAALVSYWTSQVRIESAMQRIEERENNHYAELKASVETIRQYLLERSPR